MDKKFVIDSNVLIYSYRQIYPFEIASAFWRQLIERGSERIILLDKVKDEICSNEDQLSEWLKQSESFFQVKQAGEARVISCYSEIITFIYESEQYKETAKAEFADIADSWICAYAMAYGDIVVTNEKFEPGIKRKIKVPNVCQEFNIEYVGLLEFMKELGIRFE